MSSQLRDFCHCHLMCRYCKLLLRLSSLRTVNAKSAERFLSRSLDVSLQQFDDGHDQLIT